MKKLVFFFSFIVSLNCFSAVVYDTLYLNKGQLVTVDTNYFDYYAFNDSVNFKTLNARIELAIGDSLYLAIVNNDVTPHAFDITNTSGNNITIAAADTGYIATKFDEIGIYLYHDPLDFPKYQYLGLGGMIIVDDFGANRFYWNIKEHNGAWNDTLVAGYSVDWSTYYPDYFTINGLSNPFINDDPAARIIGNVGDTIRIYIANTGMAIHSLHFHGYHLEIISSSENESHEGRSKDTFPIKSSQSMILELIPDKTGEYPVHDHNLVAVSGGGIYPNGMFLTMLIE
ncbi:MAG: multicopper oxidase domain-containing protein [Crocinitomicaceae bacterium]